MINIFLNRVVYKDKGLGLCGALGSAGYSVSLNTYGGVRRIAEHYGRALTGVADDELVTVSRRLDGADITVSDELVIQNIIDTFDPVVYEIDKKRREIEDQFISRCFQNKTVNQILYEIFQVLSVIEDRRNGGGVAAEEVAREAKSQSRQPIMKGLLNLSDGKRYQFDAIDSSALTEDQKISEANRIRAIDVKSDSVWVI